MEKKEKKKWTLKIGKDVLMAISDQMLNWSAKSIKDW